MANVITILSSFIFIKYKKPLPHQNTTSGKLFFFPVKDLYKLNMFYDFPSLEWHKLLNVNTKRLLFQLLNRLKH